MSSFYLQKSFTQLYVACVVTKQLCDLKLFYDRHLQDWTNPPHRRPHKFPAHTVKDRWWEPAGPSFPPRDVSSKGAAHYRAFSMSVNTPFTGFLMPSRNQPRSSNAPRCAGPTRITNLRGFGKGGFRSRSIRSGGDEPHALEIALPDLQDALETGRKHPLCVLEHLAIDPHRALGELAAGLAIAGGQTDRLQ